MGVIILIGWKWGSKWLSWGQKGRWRGGGQKHCSIILSHFLSWCPRFMKHNLHPTLMTPCLPVYTLPPPLPLFWPVYSTLPFVDLLLPRPSCFWSMFIPSYLPLLISYYPVLPVFDPCLSHPISLCWPLVGQHWTFGDSAYKSRPANTVTF